MLRALDLHDGAMRRLAQEAMAPDPAEPFGAYVFRSDEPAAELARRVEQDVFLEAFGNTPEMLAEEYEPYDAATFFVCIIDHLRCLPAGLMRIVVPSPTGFKTVNDVASLWAEPIDDMALRSGLVLDHDRMWDIATLAVARDYRGKATTGLVTLGLYQAVSLLTQRSGIEWLVAILDRVVFRVVQWKLRIVWDAFQAVPALPYLGSRASLPVWCSISAGQRDLPVTHPELYELLVEGKGLEAAIRPLDMERALDDVDLVTQAGRRRRVEAGARSGSGARP